MRHAVRLITERTTRQLARLPTRVTRRRIGALSLTLGAFAVGCGAAATQPTTAAPAAPVAAGGVTRTNEEGQVTVKVSWAGAKPGASTMAFDVVMDTHAVELDGYDLRQLAVLRTDGGIETPPSDWTSPKGGHHREGTLVFPASIKGASLVAPGARTLELLIRDIAGVPVRTFTWPL